MIEDINSFDNKAVRSDFYKHIYPTCRLFFSHLLTNNRTGQWFASYVGAVLKA